MVFNGHAARGKLLRYIDNVVILKVLTLRFNCMLSTLLATFAYSDNEVVSVHRS